MKERPARLRLQCAAALQAVALAGCASGPESTPQPPDEVIPVARVVSQANSADAGRAINSFLRHDGVADERFPDTQFKSPGHGREPLFVDCQSVTWVGIMLAVDLGTSEPTPRLRFSWSHQGVVLEGDEYNEIKGPYSIPFRHRSQPLRLYVDTIGINREHERVSGVYSVEVFYRGSPIYADSFNFFGCDEPAS